MGCQPGEQSESDRSIVDEHSVVPRAVDLASNHDLIVIAIDPGLVEGEEDLIHLVQGDELVLHQLGHAGGGQITNLAPFLDEGLDGVFDLRSHIRPEGVGCFQLLGARAPAFESRLSSSSWSPLKRCNRSVCPES